MAATLKDRRDEFPARLSPVKLAFEAEIQRVIADDGINCEDLIKQLADVAGVVPGQIYNYRSGKTIIPELSIPKFCRFFGSNAIAMAMVEACYTPDVDEHDDIDLSLLISRTIQDFLKLGDEFIEAMTDGTITGREYAKLSFAKARIHRNAHRLGEVIDFEYNRRKVA